MGLFLFCPLKLLIVFGWIKASNCCCVQDRFGDFLSCYAPFKLKAQQTTSQLMGINCHFGFDSIAFMCLNVDLLCFSLCFVYIVQHCMPANQAKDG